MKKLNILLLFSILSFNVQAQDFIEQVIDNSLGFVPIVRVADLDEDGHDDIIALAFQSDGILVWFGDGLGNFGEPVIIENENESSDGRHDIEFLDINNDDILDIVATPELETESGISKQLVFYINNGDRTFQDGQFIDFVNINSRSFGVLDINNDNFDDLLVTGFSGAVNDLLFYPNLGNGTFGSSSILIEDFGRGVLIEDLNNDNLLDIIREFGVPGIFINNGDSTFTERDIPFGIGSFCIFSGFIDQNNSLDLLISSLGDTGGVGWYSNDGNANFTYEETLNSLVNQSHTEGRIADFDGDGNSDLVAGNVSSDQSLYWWRNQGNENFGNFIEISNTFNGFARSLEVADFNEDGRIDFVVGNSDGLFWFENNIPLNIEENAFDVLAILPNPSDGIFNITLSNTNKIDELIIDIFNSIGQHILSVNNSTSINISDYPVGLYFAKIKNGEGQELTQKLIKY